MADFIRALCYEQRIGHGQAAKLIAGFKHVYPELSDLGFPLAHKASKSFELNRPGGEGEGAPWEAIMVMAEFLAEEWYPGEALCLLLATDTALREMDWEQLLREDVHDDGERMALELGKLERGETSKTGPKQGVVVGRDWIRLMMLVWIRDIKPSDRVFPFTQQHMRNLWNWAKRVLHLDLGPLHTVRHTEPAASVEERRRSLEELRRLGRWASLRSVERYSKHYLLVGARERLPPEVRSRGAHLPEHPGELVVIVLEAQPRAVMGCCRRRRRPLQKSKTK